MMMTMKMMMALDVMMKLTRRGIKGRSSKRVFNKGFVEQQ